MPIHHALKTHVLLECHCWVVDFQRGFGKTEICYCSFLRISYLGKSGLFCWWASSVASSPSTCRQQLIFFCQPSYVSPQTRLSLWRFCYYWSLTVECQEWRLDVLLFVWTIDNSLGFQLWEIWLSVRLFICPWQQLYIVRCTMQSYDFETN